MEEIFFATGNQGKFEELASQFEEHGFKLRQVDVDIPEIDAVDVEEVAVRKVRDSFKAVVDQDLIEENEVLVVDDTGFFVESLDGFPGAEAAFFAKTAGVENLLPMMEGETNRKAYFKTAIAAYFPEKDRVETFTGKMDGRIPEEKKGESHPHLPYNSYFIPDHSDRESLAENSDLKNAEMHRRKAVESFLDWLTH